MTRFCFKNHSHTVPGTVPPQEAAYTRFETGADYRLELESADVPELGDNVSSFSCKVVAPFWSSPKRIHILLAK